MEAFDIEFHNVDHLERDGLTGAWKLCRFPKEVSDRLGTDGNRKGRVRAGHCQGCEIQFVTDGPGFELVLSAAEHDVEFQVCKGDLFHSAGTVKAGIITVIREEEPQIFKDTDFRLLKQNRYAPQVWRIQFGMHGPVFFYSLDTFGADRRPPNEGERPDVTWVAYGSSITSGSRAGMYSGCFINQAAITLGYAALNKGMAGSCLCEPEMAGYLAGLDADVLTMEIGVNMMNLFGEEELERRTVCLLDALRKSPAKQIFLINLFPGKYALLSGRDTVLYRHSIFFREMFAAHALKAAGEDRRFQLIPGEEVLENSSYLSTDLVHPSGSGHIRMGINLTKRMAL